MEKTMERTMAKTDIILTPEELLAHWQGHRNLTRRLITMFPEKEFFTFSIGGMRTCAELIMEVMGIGAPGIREMATGESAPLSETFNHGHKKSEILRQWDEDTAEINKRWAQIPAHRFQENIKIFGQYEGTVMSSILYFIDNEIHHRGQAYVYMRALGLTPPVFYER